MMCSVSATKGISPKMVYEASARLFEDERHFNLMQNTLRSLSSAWLLAAFAAMGLLLQHNAGQDYVVHRTLLITVVAAMGVIGIGVLFLLDQMVYQNLLSASFLVGLQMEYDFPFLPPTRATSLVFSMKAASHGMPQILKWYYFAPIWFLILSALIGAVAYMAESADVILGGILLLGVLLMGVAACYVMRRSRFVASAHKHDHLPNAKFREVLRTREFDVIVARHDEWVRCSDLAGSSK